MDEDEWCRDDETYWNRAYTLKLFICEPTKDPSGDTTSSTFQPQPRDSIPILPFDHLASMPSPRANGQRTSAKLLISSHILRMRVVRKIIPMVSYQITLLINGVFGPSGLEKVHVVRPWGKRLSDGCCQHILRPLSSCSVPMHCVGVCRLRHFFNHIMIASCMG